MGFYFNYYVGDNLKMKNERLGRENSIKLDDIGFLEIIETRAKNFSDEKFSYCEWIITSKCNFDCPYCNKFTSFSKRKPNPLGLG